MFKNSNFRESDKYKTKVYPYTVVTPARRKEKPKTIKVKKNKIPKTTKKRTLDNNVIELFTAYGFLVITYPHFFKLINETTGNSWDWYWNKGALLSPKKTPHGVITAKYGNFLDPEDVALAIKKYDL